MQKLPPPFSFPFPLFLLLYVGYFLLEEDFMKPSFAAFKKRALQNEEVKKAYDLLEPEFALVEKFI